MTTNIIKSDDDCFFFFNATCTKGDACPFRHSNVAYGSDVVCSFWREGKCIKGVSCKYRHMDVRKTRNKVECFFERQPGGCKKPHCPFLHSSRSQTRSVGEDITDGITSDAVDLQTTSSEQPIPTSKSASSLTDQEIKGGDSGGDLSFGSEANFNEISSKPCATPPFSPNSSSSKLLPTSPSSTAATIGSEPVSFSIDIAEESENEPEDIGHSEKKSIKLTSCNHNIEQNFGVKTLEQIRMEKVFRQNDVNKQSLEPEHSGTSNKQFRVKLKRKSTSNNSNINPITSTSHCAATVTTNITTTINESKPISPGFGIKSLDEIRREKEQAVESSSMKMSTDCEQEDKPKKVVKIKRTHLEINKPSEPPTKVVKINKPLVEKSVSIKPLIKCNLSPVQSTASTKVQQPPPRINLRTTRPAPKTTQTSSDILKSPEQPRKLKLKLTPESRVTPTPVLKPTTKRPVPVKQLEDNKPTNVKLELKNLTISPKKQSIIKPNNNQQSPSNLSSRMDVGNNQSAQNPGYFYSSHQQDDYNVIADDDNDDDEDDKYNSDSSSNVSLKSEDKQIGSRISTSSLPPISHRDEAGSQQEERGDNDGDLTGTLEEDDSPSKNDDDLLEEDDLLADGESALENVTIEDEDDEFLKEIEHVINS